MCGQPDWGLCSQPPHHLPISRHQNPLPGTRAQTLREPGAPCPVCCCRSCSLLPPGPQPLALCYPEPCGRLQPGFCFPGTCGPPPPRPAPPGPQAPPSAMPAVLQPGIMFSSRSPNLLPRLPEGHFTTSLPGCSSQVQFCFPVVYTDSVSLPVPISHTCVHTHMHTRTGLAPFLLLACATFPPSAPSV